MEPYQAGHMYKLPGFANMPAALQDLYKSDREVARFMQSLHESLHGKTQDDTESFDSDDVLLDDDLDPRHHVDFPREECNQEAAFLLPERRKEFFALHTEYAKNPDCSEWYENKTILYWDNDNKRYCELLVECLADHALREHSDLSFESTVDDEFTDLLLTEAALFTYETSDSELLEIPKNKEPITMELKKWIFLKALFRVGEKETVKGLNKSNISDETLDEEREAAVQRNQAANECRTNPTALLAHLDNISSEISHRFELVKHFSDDDPERDAEIAEIRSLMKEQKRLRAPLGRSYDESM